MKKIRTVLMLIGAIGAINANAQTIQRKSGLSEIRYNPNGDLRIYPNPAKDVVNVRVDSDKIQKLEVFDAKGVSLLRQPMLPNGKMDISKLPPGTYLITATAWYKTYSKKLVIVK
jgi:hypothetical protein